MMLKTVKVVTFFAASLAASILADQCLDGTDTCMIGSHQRDATSLLQVGKNFMLGTGRGAILEDGDDDDKPEEGAPGMDAGPDEAPPGSDGGPGWSGELTEVPVDQGVPGAESQLGKDWQSTPMREFTVQCSHNTYLLGVQASATATSSVDVNSMPLSLDLGYRCIEIDVWPRKGPKPVADVTGGVWAGPGHDQVTHSLMKVTHHNNEGPAQLQGDVLNNLDLTLFVKALMDWLENDEKEFKASAANPKMPLIISIENRANDEISNAGKIPIEDLENYIHTVFSWLDQGLDKEKALVSRIVKEGVFGSPQGEIGRAISDSGARQIILKSKIHSMDSELHKIIAMKDMDHDSDVDLKSKSKSMDACSVSEKKEEKIRALVGDGSTMVRTYPSAINQRSGNYNPSGAFKARAQMICINLQGHCDGLPSQQKCSDVPLGAPFNPDSQKGSKCTCSRDIAASLENMFTRYGFDGYINYNAVPVEELENFPYNEASSCKAAAATASAATAAKEGVKTAAKAAAKAPVWAMTTAIGAAVGAARATGSAASSMKQGAGSAASSVKHSVESKLKRG